MVKKTLRARVLSGFILDNVRYNPNDIIESDPKLINSLGTSVDTSKEAVDYCLSQKEPVIKVHEFNEPEPIKPPEGNESGKKGNDANTGANPEGNTVINSEAGK